MFNTSKFLTIITIGLLSLSTVACQTVEGAGQDIENAGEAVQRAAK